ncbi:MAG TPA: tetratricopeptide repeat protein [Syntrophorhabdaceae bacterium]|nr:tetratricopeptide repeat protein [Syntrophorhabdaceae bacterium]HQM81647.1 tetratricopeptide repeat protein [Syntrophorhabdaceae bacterium]
MRYKIFFFLFFVFLLFYLYISNLNSESVKLYYGGGNFFEMSVADFVVVAFVLGVIFSIIVSFFYDMKNAVINWKTGRKEKKTEEFKEVFEKAKSYDMKGDREKAIETLDRIIRRFPDMEEPPIVLADMYTSMEEYEKALEILSDSERNLGKREVILLKKVKVFRAMKDLQKTEAVLKDILNLNESNMEALAMLRDFYIWKKDWNEAYELEKRIRKFIKTEEENRRFVGIRYERIYEMYHKKLESNEDKVIDELKDIINDDKRFVPAYILLAEIYKRKDKLNEAGRVYGRGYSKTGHIIFLLRMEDLYIDRGTPEVILKIYTRVLDVSPKNHLTSFLYARLCLRLEMIDEAIDTLDALIAEGEDFKGLHRAMAEAYIHRGEMENAVEEFRSAFPIEQSYIPFICTKCQAIKEEWTDFCESCFSWNTINVKKEEFMHTESEELKTLYEREDWTRAGS